MPLPDRRMLLFAAPALICAATAAAPFAPRDGVPYRYTMSQLRVVDGKSYRAGLSRRIVFRRTAGGWLAEFSTVSIDDSDPSAAVAKLRGALKDEAGKVTRVRLDPAGQVTGVDELDTLWAAFVAHVEALGGERIAAPLKTFPLQQRIEMTASPILDLIAVGDAAKPLGDRKVTVPAQVPGGAAITLSGSEHVAAQGALHTIVTQASATGDAPLPPGAAPTDAPSRQSATSFTRTRLVDPATGLVARSVEVQRTLIGNGPAPAEIRTETSFTLTPW